MTENNSLNNTGSKLKSSLVYGDFSDKPLKSQDKLVGQINKTIVDIKQQVPTQDEGQSSHQASQSPSDPTQNGADGIRLQRTIGLWNGIAIIAGIIIGSGIFATPTGVLKEAGSPGLALVVWLSTGLYSMLGALCFAELGTSISCSGGDYSYIRQAYGPVLSFMYLWVICVVIMPCSNAISSLTFAKYILEPFFVGCEVPNEAIRFTALALLLILTYINCASVKGSIWAQSLCTICKGFVLVLMISFGAYYAIIGKSRINSENLWEKSQTDPSHIAQAFYSGFYAYAGWNSLNFITEEMKSPAKNMPRAIILSMAGITLLYILTNLAYFIVLDRTEILESEAVAVLFGWKVLGNFHWVIPIAVALSTMGGLNGCMFSSSRVLVVGAREGQLCSAFEMIHAENLSPVPSLITLGLLSTFYLVTTEIIVLVEYTIFIEAIFAGLAVSTVLVFRYKYPDAERPLKVPLIAPILYLLISVLMIVLPIWSSPIQALIGVLVTLASIPVYFLTANWTSKPARYQNTIDGFNSLVSKLTNSVKPDS